MKIAKKELKKIIKQELKAVLNEGTGPFGLPPLPPGLNRDAALQKLPMIAMKMLKSHPNEMINTLANSGDSQNFNMAFELASTMGYFDEELKKLGLDPDDAELDKYFDLLDQKVDDNFDNDVLDLAPEPSDDFDFDGY